MTFVLTALVLIFIAYVCGSLPFGYWAGRMKGVDIRKHGSGNIGATNVIRVLGKKTGIPVFILDMLKGSCCPHCWPNGGRALRGGGQRGDASSPSSAGRARCWGTCSLFGSDSKVARAWPLPRACCWGWRHGRWWWALVIWLIVVFFISRYVALASIAASIVIPVAMTVIMTFQQRWNFVLLGLGLVMGTLVVVRHRSNIGAAAFWNGEGLREGKKK